MVAPIEVGTTICFRFLEDDEFYKLSAIFKENGTQVPDPKFSRVAVGELDGEIIGFYVFQLVPHAEPMWIKEELRGTNIWYQLAKMIEPLTHKKSTYILATNPTVEKLCRTAEMREIECKVFVKDVIEEEI